VKIWYDREGDYLEVTFDPRPGFFRETASDEVMEKVDQLPSKWCSESLDRA